MSLHAAAGVEHQDDRERHALRGVAQARGLAEVRDVLLHAVLEQLDVLRAEAAHGLARLVEDHRGHRDDVDVDLERERLRGRHLRRGWAAGACGRDEAARPSPGRARRRAAASRGGGQGAAAAQRSGRRGRSVATTSATTTQRDEHREDQQHDRDGVLHEAQRGVREPAPWPRTTRRAAPTWRRGARAPWARRPRRRARAEVSGSATVPRTEAASTAPATGRSGVPITSSAWSTAGILSPITSIARRDAEDHERLVGGQELEGRAEVEHAEPREAAGREQRQPGAQARRPRRALSPSRAPEGTPRACCTSMNRD